MKHFSNLHDGWADLTIDDFKCSCSYIQDIPMTILNAWEDYQNTGSCIILIDSEGIDYEIIITVNGAKIITYDSRVSLKVLKNIYSNEQIINLLKELVFDIIDNVDEWAKWLCLCDKNDSQYEKALNKYKRDIIKKAKELGF